MPLGKHLIRNVTTGVTTEVDPTAEEQAASDAAETAQQQVEASEAATFTERTAADGDVLANVLAAYQRLAQIQTQMTNVATQATAVVNGTNANATSAATIKQMAQGIGVLANAIGDEATDLRFIARKLAADLGFTVSDAA